ncbi:Hypothetical protein CHV_a0130 [Cardinium endosymbiont cBtQ1 of Bemisia tabaci]|nr:Hypothetical protein CHV_a0130 [Cardinium endosymbiont cBtQ1 of Bemisia tabaci]
MATGLKNPIVPDKDLLFNAKKLVKCTNTTKLRIYSVYSQ